MDLSKKKYLHSLITVLIMLTFPLLPNIGQITDPGMKALGITIGMLYGWVFVDLAWPSIFGLVLLGTSGLMNTTAVFSTGFGNQVIISCILFFAFSKMMDEMKVSDYIASVMLTQKALFGRPWLLVTSLLATAFLIGVLCDGFPAIFLTWSFALAITDMSGYKRTDNIVGFLICSIVFASCLGGLVLPFKAIPLAFMGFFQSATGLTIDMASFAVFITTVGIISLVILLLLAKFVLRLDVSRLSVTEEQLNLYKGEVTIQQKFGLFMMLALIVLLLFPSFMPKSWAITVLLQNWGTLGCIGLLLIIPAILQDKEGRPLITVSKLMSGISWDIIWLLMAIMVIASCINGPETGIMSTVSNAIAPKLNGLNPIAFLVIATLIVSIVTQFAANLIVGALFIPLLIPLYMAMGGNPVVCFFVLYCGFQSAYATPAASATAALMHGHENLSPKQAYGYGLLFMFILLIVGLVVGIPLGNLLT